MENTGRTLRNAEELRDKAEYAVKEHIRGIKLPAALIALNAPSEDDKQHDVEDYLKLPRRPARGFGAEDKAALAAARYDAVDTGAHQGKHHADEKDIKDLARLALEQLCAEEVSDGHQEDSAENAHIPEGRGIKSGFGKGK